MESFNLSIQQKMILQTICQFVVGVFAPSWITVYLHPSAVSGPENILIIQNLLLSCDAVCKEGVEKAVKTCFLSHAVTWFTPQNLGLASCLTATAAQFSL